MDAHLVHMANDIAAFHRTFPEDEAMQMVAEHINKSWAPSMRRSCSRSFRPTPVRLTA